MSDTTDTAVLFGLLMLATFMLGSSMALVQGEPEMMYGHAVNSEMIQSPSDETINHSVIYGDLSPEKKRVLSKYNDWGEYKDINVKKETRVDGKFVVERPNGYWMVDVESEGKVLSPMQGAKYFAAMVLFLGGMALWVATISERFK